MQKMLYLQWRIKDSPWEGAPTLRGRGAQTYDFAKFSKKRHEIEEILGRKGACTGVAPLSFAIDL